MSLENVAYAFPANFEIRASFSGQEGLLELSVTDLSFICSGEVLECTAVNTLKSVRLLDIGDERILYYKKDDREFHFSLHDDSDTSEEFYHALKMKFINQQMIDTFIKESVLLSSVECKKMFDLEVMVRLFDHPLQLLHNEKIKGILPARYAPGFNDHLLGLIYATTERVVFCSKDQVVKELALDNLQDVRIIKSFSGISDNRGRSTYNIEFNQSDFTVCVQSDRHIKIEMFYHSVWPGHEYDEHF